MSQLSRSLPLARIHPLEEVPRVELYLDEPLTISQSSKRRRLGQQILALLHGIDLLVQKEEHSGLNLSDKIDAIVLELEELISKQSEKYKTAQEYVKFTGLATVFPRASSRLGIDVTTEEVSYNVQDHFSHMSLMNQVVSTALQLQKDIGISNHKYIAHQLALLYVSITNCSAFTPSILTYWIAKP
ncbi:hypothetical protein K7432_000136 [Basidiobolus ranarum]|uniref:Uncharacterized protein n=1 Tax=Basidiobolus ranarum TaxID=34480 RepID=A0ABR2WBM2_9FUNG